MIVGHDSWPYISGLINQMHVNIRDKELHVLYLIIRSFCHNTINYFFLYFYAVESQLYFSFFPHKNISHTSQKSKMCKKT